MKVKIRFATIKDFKTVQSLNLSLFKKEYKEYDKTLNTGWPFSRKGKQYYKRRLSGEGCALIASIDGTPIGYLLGSIIKVDSYQKKSVYAELENMFVVDQYRNMKVGTGLIKVFLKWCKSKKVKRVKVKASAHNLSGLQFYRKNRFGDYNLVLEKDL